MSGISLIAVLALVYLINTMRRSISLKKCLLASGENQVKRQDPKSRSFRFPLGTRPKVWMEHLHHNNRSCSSQDS